MGTLALETESLAVVQKSLAITDLDFGYKYGGFRPVGRFLNQLDDNEVGLITWPGGTLSERDTDRYGFQHDGLFNPELNRPDLADMFRIANKEGAGLSVILPTSRYEGNETALRADVQGFMVKLLSGHYGPLPPHLQFEVGNEWFVSFGKSVADAAAYGRIADIYVDVLSSALNDPAINRIGADIDIAVQGGRTMPEDAAIRDQFTDDHLAEVDLVTHHRFPLVATGVDKAATMVGTFIDAWEADALAVGGDRPDLFLGAYNVASLTRDEALARFIKAEAAQGKVVQPEDIDLEGRTDVAFETFWQKALGKHDYGPEHPRLLLEMFAEYGGEGMRGAGVYGVDMVHPGRFTVADADGGPQDFVGQDLLDMLAESTPGTRVLKVSLENDRSDDVWTYAFESADKLVVFLSADDLPPGEMTLALKGLGTTYKAVYGDSLTSDVPQDWMDRFGIPDTEGVDETNEGKTFAIGLRSAVAPRITQAGVTVDLDQPYEVIRLSFAKTEAGLRDIAGYSDDDGLLLAGPDVLTGEIIDEQGDQGEPPAPAPISSDPGGITFDDLIEQIDDPTGGGPEVPEVPEEIAPGEIGSGDDGPDAGQDDTPETDTGGDSGDDSGAGALVLALLPLLFLL